MLVKDKRNQGEAAATLISALYMLLLKVCELEMLHRIQFRAEVSIQGIERGGGCACKLDALAINLYRRKKS